MEFRTECIIPAATLPQLSIRRPVILVGSCFSDNIARKMRESLWRAFNPGGALYNPLSVAAALRMLLLDDDESRFVGSIVEVEEAGRRLVHSMMFDSSMSSRSREGVVRNFRLRRDEARRLMKDGADLIVTFGTSIAYFEDNGAGPVGNCHKLPSSRFVRRMLEIGEICDEWTRLVGELRDVYGEFNIVFTISPIRHVRDGLPTNSLSKAMLRVAVDRLVGRLASAYYFPAFELLTDDLRDYRFYAADMVHPSDVAVEYIWDKFRNACLSDADRAMLRRAGGVARLASHRSIIEPTPEEARQRRSDIARRFAEVRREWPDCLDLPGGVDAADDDPIADVRGDKAGRS